MRNHRAAAATFAVAVVAALPACTLPAPFGADQEAPPGWERVTVDGLALTGPVEPYQPGRLLASGRLGGRSCLVELTLDRAARCLPNRDNPPRVPSATALSSNGQVILAVEWQDMADATPPAVWAGDDVRLSRESLAPGSAGNATAFVDAATSDDEAIVVGTVPSDVCPHGAVAAWAVRSPGLVPFGAEGPCVDAGSASPLRADTGDGWLLVAGPLFAPGSAPSSGGPTQTWFATAEDEEWGTARWQRVATTDAADLVTDVVVAADGVVAGSRADRPVLVTVSGDRATTVDVPDDLLDHASPTVLVAHPGTGARPVVLAVQGPRGTRVWTQRRDGWYAVDGPRGQLTSAVEMDDATYLALRDDDGEVTLWVRPRVAGEASPPAYRAQR
jgi:hypothetical protein